MELIGRGGQSKSGGEEGGVRRRMSLLTQKRGLISQGGLAFCSEMTRGSLHFARGTSPQKRVIWDVREAQARLRGFPEPNLIRQSFCNVSELKHRV